MCGSKFPRNSIFGHAKTRDATPKGLCHMLRRDQLATLAYTQYVRLTWQD